VLVGSASTVFVPEKQFLLSLESLLKQVGSILIWFSLLFDD
jgi:hypothetical protein